MDFSEFTKKLKIKDYLTGLRSLECHELNFAKMFFLNKLTKFNKNFGTRQTGRTTHNILLAVYNYVCNEESSLIVVLNTEEKQRVIRNLESFTTQLGLPDRVIYSNNYSHDYINILSLNAWKDQKNEIKKKYNHIFIDNDIVDKYHEFLHGKSHDRGNDFFLGLCIDFSNALKQNQNKKSLKSMNCLIGLSSDEIIVSSGVKFKEGDLFAIIADKDIAFGIGTLININYNKRIDWFSTIDILFDNNIIQMPAHNIEYFTKL